MRLVQKLIAQGVWAASVALGVTSALAAFRSLRSLAGLHNTVTVSFKLLLLWATTSIYDFTLYVGHQHVKHHPRVMVAFINILNLFPLFLAVCAWPAPAVVHGGAPVSANVFESLEELARIVDIAYCVGTSGIQKPFQCLSRCTEFDGFELITTWNTGPLLSDSCGYIAISHEPFEKRVIVAFRGTYSIANTIADLSTRHAEYVPFPADNDSHTLCSQSSPTSDRPSFLPQLTRQHSKRDLEEPDCKNCTIHSGFLTSWQNTRCTILPHVEDALEKHPDYKLVLVGHSLGGAVATVAALEFQARGYEPHVTTFGEPRLGNRELNRYIDRKFNLNATSPDDALFRRVTHVDDPVPLLPLEEWGYEMHAGEIFISKASLPPARSDLHACAGDADPKCIAGGGSVEEANAPSEGADINAEEVVIAKWGLPSRYKLWQLFFAHRDYFWRLGLCVPGGDPWDWNRGSLRYDSAGHDDEL
ncbi:hypothetical protein OHC33_009712 [Knufia fluminis]|uniref:Fungal lipase-type domain-containing protein n=1 Tax=Knufia fluminis TaxID=191047 RepID=A0AAN8EL19_9EURO|nr:hypothetical protein OHC33_009712 [Knufia fluminis]